MTVSKARELTKEEFAKLSEECNGFNDEVYKNHPLHNKDEKLCDFMQKGSARIKNNPMIKGKLI